MITDLQTKRESIQKNLLTSREVIDDKKLYSFDGFLSSLQVLADGTVQGLYFYVGHDISSDLANRQRGLVNVAAFLAHSKTMAVFNSVCDERNIDDIGGKFALTNACGQHGSSYQNLRCAPSEAHMECPPDPDLQMTAVAPLTRTNGKDGPPPFFCGPKEYFPFVGYHDAESDDIIINAPFANRGKSAPCLVLRCQAGIISESTVFVHSQLAEQTSRDAAGGGKNPCFLCPVLNYDVPLTIFRLFCFQAWGSTTERGMPLWKA